MVGVGHGLREVGLVGGLLGRGQQLLLLRRGQGGVLVRTARVRVHSA